MSSKSDAESGASCIPGYVELQQLAVMIESRSGEKVRAFLDYSIVGNLARIAVKIMPAGTSRGSYELLQVRAPNFQYPVVLEVTHFDDEHRTAKCADSDALLDSLKSALENERTKRIIQLLADESVARIEKSEPRPFLVADTPFNHKGTLMTHVAFLGFGGFLSLNTMQRLAKEPDTDGAAVQSYDNKYVATFSFEGDIKVTLSKEEMLALQSKARSIVGGAD